MILNLARFLRVVDAALLGRIDLSLQLLMELALASQVVLVFRARPTQSEGARELSFARSAMLADARALVGILLIFFLFHEVIFESGEQAEGLFVKHDLAAADAADLARLAHRRDRLQVLRPRERAVAGES